MRCASSTHDDRGAEAIRPYVDGDAKPVRGVWEPVRVPGLRFASDESGRGPCRRNRVHRGGEQGRPTLQQVMSNEERRAQANLMIMCATCHKVIDTDVAKWMVQKLQALKAEHEAIYTGAIDLLRRQVGDITEGVTWASPVTLGGVYKPGEQTGPSCHGAAPNFQPHVRCHRGAPRRPLGGPGDDCGDLVPHGQHLQAGARTRLK